MKKYKIISLITLACLLTTSVLAMDRTVIRKLGGFVTRVNEYELQDYEASDISNFVLDKAGSITERNLFKQYNSASIGSKLLDYVYKFYKSTDDGYLVVTTGDKLYKATGGSLTDISLTANTVYGSQWAFETFTDGTNEQVFGANVGTGLAHWNGTNTTFSAETTGGETAPGTNCNILKKHKSRLWAAGSTTYPYKLYYSSLNNGLNWSSSGGSLDLPSLEKIMALETLGDILYVFTRTSIYAVVGDTPQEFYLQRTASKVGTHAFKSVVKGGSVIYFLNKSGVFIFDGNDSTNISENIQPTIDSISDTYIGSSAGLFDNRGRYWLSHTSTNGTFNDTVVIYDTVVKQWYRIDGVNLSSFLKAEGGTDKGELYAGSSNPVGFLWQLQAGSGIEQLTHSTYDQLSSGVTFNTTISSTPTVELLSGNDYATKLLLHFDGTDGATTYTSEDYAKRTVSFSGTSRIETDQEKFGVSSLWLDGNSDSVNVPDDNDWYFGTDKFTIDFWVRFDSVAANRNLFSQGTNVASYSSMNWQVASQRLTLSVRGGGADLVSCYTSFAPATNTWYHIALIRNGTTDGDWYISINGILYNPTFDGGSSANAMPDIADTFKVGVDAVNSNYMGGYIDEFRVTKGAARWTSNFTVPTAPYAKPTYAGNLTSQNLQINASGQDALGTIRWNETLPSNTDIQFTTRTGTTNDTVYYNGWGYWISSNVVTINSVTSNSAWTTSNWNYLTINSPNLQQSRNVLYYETYDNVSPNSVHFDVSRGSVSNGWNAEIYLPKKDISSDTFIGYWLMSPCTGESVKLSIGEVSPTVVAYTTANTVVENTWEYHYWSLSGISSTDLDGIGYMRVNYLGDVQGSVYLGEVDAYDFLDSGDSITSTPNDWIQYKAIMGSNDPYQTPKLITANSYVVLLSYSASGGAEETSLTSYWKSKRFDFGQPNYNKLISWVELTGESNNDTTGNTIYLDYELDGGERTGTLSSVFPVTDSTTKVRFYFPSGTYGKDFQFTIRNTDTDDDIRIDNATIIYYTEATP